MRYGYLILAALMLTGCRGEKETGKIKPSGDIEQFRELKDSDERELVLRYESSIGYGLQYECFTRVFDLYSDASVDVYGEAAAVSEEDNCCETLEIGEEQYEEIIEYISESGIDAVPEVECDDQACDAGSSYMTFYDENGEFNSIGGYCVIDEEFGTLARLIVGAVPEDDRNHIFDAFEEIYAEVLG